ncbi:placenta-expressed transcript 1 protein [Macrochelys suwanniensis]
MAALTSTLQLLFLGALISPVYLLDDCQPIQNATLGSYNLSVTPADYKANTNYNVTISGATNSSSVILQALNTENSSVGRWEDPAVNCSNGGSVGKQNISTTATVQWTSPANETAPVEISVFVTFSDGSTQFQKKSLNTASTVLPASSTVLPASSTVLPASTTRSPTTTKTTNSVSTVQASSFLLATVHLLSVFVTGKLFC